MFAESDLLTYREFATKFAREFDVPLDGLSPSTRLIEDLAFDSLTGFRVLLFAEALASTEVPDDEPPSLLTIEDAYDHYRSSVHRAPDE